MKKEKNVYMIIWGFMIGVSLLITIGLYVLDAIEDNKDNEEAITIVENIFTNDTIQYLIDNISVTYCGSGENIGEEELGLDYNWNGYYKCTNFNSYEELTNYFKQYVTESYFNILLNKQSYLKEQQSNGYYNYYEKDGNLYAANTGKGSNVQKYKLLNDKITYEIEELSDDEIVALITAKWENASGSLYSEKGRITIAYDNGNWKVRNYEIVNDKSDTDSSSDSSSLAVGYEADTPEEFIDYLNEYDYAKYSSYAVTYNLIEVKAIRNEDKKGFKYKIYYGGEELEYSGLTEGDYLKNGEFYLLNDNQNKAFVFVNRIGIADESEWYDAGSLILVFDIKGNILMSEAVHLRNNFKVSDNVITYSYLTGVILEVDSIGNCETLGLFNSDDVAVSGDKEIKYSNGELSVVKDTKKTIGDYKSSCN